MKTPNAKIVVTLGPASDSLETVCALIRRGTTIFRLNASHGEWAQHQSRIETVREAERQTGMHAAVLLDLQGPKIRLGRFATGKCQLVTGARFRITTKEVLGDNACACTTFEPFARDVKPGDRVLLNDGAVTLKALASDGVAVDFEVISGGVAGDRKGINLPGVQVSAPSLTEKDLADLDAGLAAGVDFIALSFVRTAKDVQDLRARMGNSKIPIVAKIEKPEAVDNIESILDVANGIMVARGDLGVEMSLEMVPPIQKKLILAAQRRNRFVITATQMLESMIESPNPTRAEVSDVANAIYDGTDAVMLSAETSVGKFPFEAVDYMARIAFETECGLRETRGKWHPEFLIESDSEVVAHAAFQAARHSGSKAVVVFTEAGYSARLISRYRPLMPIIAMSNSIDVVRRLLVHYGVVPVLAPVAGSTDAMLSQMDTLLVEMGLLTSGDKVVFVAGTPVG
ncbi:MAG: pyruvate kinase, partial [Bryobacterales bacterium]|nr:pyruvate kinase [Bryobacterales bacterium]